MKNTVFKYLQKNYFKEVVDMRGFIENIGLMFKYMGLTIINPLKSFKQLKEEPRQVTIALFIFFFMFITYAGVVIIGGIFTRVQGYFPMIINVLPNNYYLYITIIMPFIIILNFVVYTVVEIGALAAKKPADFKYNFSIVTVALTIPWWAGFVCDITIVTGAIIQQFHTFPYWALTVISFAYGIMALATLILTPVSIYVAKGMSVRDSIITSLIGLILFWGIISLLVL